MQHLLRSYDDDDDDYDNRKVAGSIPDGVTGIFY
jgi:hypothetical protein